jgi:hypothetical protein
MGAAHAPAPLAPFAAQVNSVATGRDADGEAFTGAVTVAGLNPIVPAALQKETLERVLTLAERTAQQGKIPVVVIDHRLTGLDDRPIIKDGLQNLARVSGVTELFDVDAALKSGTLKSLPGYTEQASDAWRQAHPELMNKYPGVFGSPGTRINIDFMRHPVTLANATAGLSELEAALKVRTGGKGKLVFAGQGTGQRQDFVSVYTRAQEQGGAGLENPDVRFGGPPVSPEADARAEQFALEYEADHPQDGKVPLDFDSRAKAGWIETLEKEEGPNGEEVVVVAFADDRLHNRIAAQAASTLGENMLAIKAAAPGLSVSQSDAANPNQVSTFSPNP